VPVFVDTNVLVYARDLSEGPKHERALGWVEHLWETRAGRLSYQVLQEYYVTVTRKLPPGLPLADARADVRDLLAWRPVPIQPDLLETAWRVEARGEVSFWDALVVAAARGAGCSHLLREDLAEGRRLGGVTVASPFAHDPGSLDR
jgi:predicted nucleic acid-binding protein